MRKALMIVFGVIILAIYWGIFYGVLFGARMWWRITHFRWKLDDEFLKKERINIAMSSM